MKNIYLFVLSFVLITSANSQVIRYTVMDVDSKDREKFETALANKTKFTIARKGSRKSILSQSLVEKTSTNM